MNAEKSNNYLYNKSLQSFANHLRKNITKAEACLWKYFLSAQMMNGYESTPGTPASGGNR